VSDYRKRAPQEMAGCLTEIFRLYVEGKVQPPAVTVVSFEGVSGGLQQIRDRQAKGRLVLATGTGAHLRNQQPR
jgi:NADPH2:quinone reductase